MLLDCAKFEKFLLCDLWQLCLILLIPVQGKNRKVFAILQPSFDSLSRHELERSTMNHKPG